MKFFFNCVICIQKCLLREANFEHLSKVHILCLSIFTVWACECTVLNCGCGHGLQKKKQPSDTTDSQDEGGKLICVNNYII